MAMESLLLEAITTWSSTHLTLRDTSFKAKAASNRCIALKSLSNALPSNDRNSEMELASCLVHCAMESISGDTTHWFGHHVGAYEVIRSTVTISDQGSIDFAPFRRT
jgi:hypothetical protein